MNILLQHKTLRYISPDDELLSPMNIHVNLNVTPTGNKQPMPSKFSMPTLYNTGDNDVDSPDRVSSFVDENLEANQQNNYNDERKAEELADKNNGDNENVNSNLQAQEELQQPVIQVKLQSATNLHIDIQDHNTQEAGNNSPEYPKLGGLLDRLKVKNQESSSASPFTKSIVSDSKTLLKRDSSSDDEKMIIEDKKNNKNKSGKDEEEVEDYSEVYSKILANYIHLVSIIGSFNFEWPEQAKSIFSTGDSVSEGTQSIFSFDCLLRQGIFKSMGMRSFFARVFIMSVAPAGLVALIAFVWWAMYKIKYRKNYKERYPIMKINIITSIVVTLFLLHPGIVELCIQAFMCTTVGDDSSNSTYLTYDLYYKCYSDEHLGIANIVALPSMIIWGIGIPYLAWMLLKKNKHQLSDPAISAKFGFLYEGYSDKYYYWEFIIFYRKMVLILVSTFLENFSIKIQASLVLGISALFYLLQVKYQPYKDTILNEMEKRSMIVSTVSIYSGMFFLLESSSSSLKVIFFCIMVGVNLYFFIYWIVEFLKAKANSLLKIKFLNKHCGNCLRKIGKFQWKLNKSTKNKLGNALIAINKLEAIKREKKLKNDNIPVHLDNPENIELKEVPLDARNISIDEEQIVAQHKMQTKATLDQQKSLQRPSSWGSDSPSLIENEQIHQELSKDQCQATTIPQKESANDLPDEGDVDDIDLEANINAVVSVQEFGNIKAKRDTQQALFIAGDNDGDVDTPDQPDE